VSETESEGGLATGERDGTRGYGARPEGMAEVHDYIEGFWSEHQLEGI